MDDQNTTPAADDDQTTGAPVSTDAPAEGAAPADAPEAEGEEKTDETPAV